MFGYFLRFSWLWGHFEGLKFGVQGTNYRLYGGENRSLVFGKKTRRFVFCFEGSKSICFKEPFSQPLIKVWKNLQPLQQHVKMTTTIGEMLAKKKYSERGNQKILLLLLYLELPKPFC
jgi:hypothetical protein